MKYITYNFKLEDLNSDMYYKEIIPISKRIKELIFKSGSKYLNDFIKYIKGNSIESVRTKDEYAIEFMMIGVMLKEYSFYGNTLTKAMSGVFNLLNRLRERAQYKETVDKIKGYLNSKVLYSRGSKRCNNIKDLLCWMKETGDFKEEVYRLKVWVDFLETRDKKYRSNFIRETLFVTKSITTICDKSLKKYIEPLKKFLKEADEKYKNREDLIY